MKNINKLFIVGGLILAGIVGINAQETYVGFQYQSNEVHSRDNANTYGINASHTAYITSNVGITGELAGGFGDNIRNYTVMGGLTAKARSFGKAEPFVHALGGVTGERVGLVSRFHTTDALAPAFVLGGGVDYKTGRRVNIRLFQVDYLRTYLFNSAQNSVRVGTGITF
jgi:hypothetical protein